MTRYSFNDLPLRLNQLLTWCPRHCDSVVADATKAIINYSTRDLRLASLIRLEGRVAWSALGRREAVMKRQNTALGIKS
jgi:hypothetical protein